jgi:hypothetical protein
MRASFLPGSAAAQVSEKRFGRAKPAAEATKGLKSALQ